MKLTMLNWLMFEVYIIRHLMPPKQKLHPGGILGKVGGGGGGGWRGGGKKMCETENSQMAHSIQTIH